MVFDKCSVYPLSRSPFLSTFQNELNKFAFIVDKAPPRFRAIRGRWLSCALVLILQILFLLKCRWKWFDSIQFKSIWLNSTRVKFYKLRWFGSSVVDEISNKRGFVFGCEIANSSTAAVLHFASGLTLSVTDRLIDRLVFFYKFSSLINLTSFEWVWTNFASDEQQRKTPKKHFIFLPVLQLLKDDDNDEDDDESISSISESSASPKIDAPSERPNSSFNPCRRPFDR